MEKVTNVKVLEDSAESQALTKAREEVIDAFREIKEEILGLSGDLLRIGAALMYLVRAMRDSGLPMAPEIEEILAPIHEVTKDRNGD